MRLSTPNAGNQSKSWSPILEIRGKSVALLKIDIFPGRIAVTASISGSGWSANPGRAKPFLCLFDIEEGRSAEECDGEVME
jgi:hypothetical protein